MSVINYNTLILFYYFHLTLINKVLSLYAVYTNSFPLPNWGVVRLVYEYKFTNFPGVGSTSFLSFLAHVLAHVPS